MDIGNQVALVRRAFGAGIANPASFILITSVLFFVSTYLKIEVVVSSL